MKVLPSFPHYDVTGLIGAGGMGEVFRARDLRLDREVAIKLVPETFTADPDRHARFHREARLMAAFSHPNVAAIHALEEHEGRHFLVMELVEGEDLGVRLTRGPMPVGEALAVARQIAGAMQAAHDRGIVHRDLKPANVMIDREGRVKVLDFGLAKLLADEPEADAQVTGSWQNLPPTLTSDRTRRGVILGTAAYMSPEQARGQRVDRRADVWAFGCVLYAMLTGRSPFPGESVSDTIAAVLKTDPDWVALPPETPPRVRDLLERCLVKDLHGRLRDLGDARIELERVQADREQSAGPAGGPRGVSGPRRAGWIRRALPVAAAALGGLLAGALLWQLWPGARGGGARALPPTELSLIVPDGFNAASGAISPDGRTVALAMHPLDQAGEQGQRRLYLRGLGGGPLREVSGSEGLQAFAYSPDGRWLAMLTLVAPNTPLLRLSRVPADLSAPAMELQVLPSGAMGAIVCLPDDRVLVQTEGMGFLVVPADGRAPRKTAVTSEEGRSYMLFPSPATVLPDGHHVLVRTGVWGEHGYRQDVCALDVETGALETVVESGAGALLASDGRLLFARGTTLLAAGFDPARRRLTGAPAALADGLRINEVWSHGWFDLSRDGTLLYQPGGLVGDERQLVLLDAQFRELGPWSADRRQFEGVLAIAPDGSRVAVAQPGTDGMFDVLLGDLAEPGLRLFADDPARECWPGCFSPDGSRLYYSRYDNTRWELVVQPVSGGEGVMLFENQKVPETAYVVQDVTPDGAFLILSRRQAGAQDLMLLPTEPGLEGAGTPRPLLEKAARARLSPDDRWLLYETEVSGRLEVCVRRLRPGGTLGPESRISTDGGSRADWYRWAEGAPYGILYLAVDGWVEVAFDAERGIRTGAPRALPAGLVVAAGNYAGTEQLPDSRLLAVKLDPAEGPPRSFVVVLGFGEKLR